MTYPGGKNGAGTYQTIINEIPPHTKFVEAFVGSGAIVRRIRKAAITIVNDKDAGVLQKFPTGFIVRNGDAMSLLRELENDGPQTFIYCDPPYRLESRSWKLPLYKHEMSDDDSHAEFLNQCIILKCRVMISHYPCEFYDTRLAGWRKVEFQSQTRRGARTECLYMNYPEPTALHDYRFLGGNFKQREHIKLKTTRLVDKLDNLPKLERLALMSAVISKFGDEIHQHHF